MIKNTLGILAIICVALTIAHFIGKPEKPANVRQHQSAREQQTLADASANRR